MFRIDTLFPRFRLAVLSGLAVLLVLTTALSGCDSFLDINEDPNNASLDDIRSEPGLLFLTAVTSLSTTKTVEITGNSSFAQLWSASNGAGVFTSPELYQISTNTTGNSWDGSYTDVNQNLNFILDAADDSESPFFNPNVAAQAKIFKAYNFYFLTQLFEEVPFTQANDRDAFPSPVFDEQEVVLRGVVDLIDEAIAQVDLSSGAPSGITNEDVFYGGDMEQWLRFANATKLRALILLESGGADVDAEIDAVFGEPLIRDNADNTEFPYSASAGNENSWQQVLDDFSDGAMIWYDCDEKLVDILLDLDDPRLATYCDPTADGDFVGSASGTFASFVSQDISNISLNIVRADFPERYTTAAEILLLEAEWEAKKGNLGTADGLYRDGIAASIDWFDEKPGAIEDSLKNAYIASLPDLTTLSQADAVEAVQLQQWINFFERRPEPWTHWRRTKVPELTAPSNAQLGDIIRRYAYPPDPVARNPNTPQSLPGDTPMWFEGG